MRKKLTADGMDMKSVTETASRLQISEFQLFKTAHCAWFGQPVPDQRVEGEFSRYMFEEIAPPWVRHFVRRARAAEAPEAVVPEQCALRRRTVSRRQAFWGWILLLGVLLFLVAFCLVIVSGIPQ